MRSYPASLTTDINDVTPWISAGAGRGGAGRGGVRVNPNIVRIAMHIDIFGWSLKERVRNATRSFSITTHSKKNISGWSEPNGGST
jgi:hypothetical protein